MKIAWVSTAVTPYSETNTEYANAATNDYLRHIVEGLNEFHIESTLLLPGKSDSKWKHVTFEGSLQNSVAVGEKVDSTGTVTGSSLAKMLDWAWDHQDEFDLIVNIGHDYLPIFMIGKFRTPFITLPNLCSTTDSMDGIIRQRAFTNPSYVWFFSKAQRSILGNDENPILTQPFNMADFVPAKIVKDDEPLGWAGRIVREKGLGLAAEIAKMLGRKLWVAGPIHDQDYFNSVLAEYPQTIDYLGCLSRKILYDQLSKTAVFLQTQYPGWQEAFGRVTAEAYLAGCPVLYNPSGANEELADLTGGGVLIELQDLKSSFEKAILLDRKLIQKNAFEQFDRIVIAKKFLHLFNKIAKQ